MATSSVPLSLLFIVMIFLSTSSHAQQDHQSRLNRANQVLRDNGYGDMAEMLDSMHSLLFPDLEVLESENKTYTVFAPGTPSFWAHSSYDPPLSLIQYHIVPFKVDRDLLASPSMVEHKLDTLLQGHPLVVTTGVADGWTPLPSLNLVPIGEWNLYNDGFLIVHGLPGFFNPGYQTARYPWFDSPEAVSPTADETPSQTSSSDFGHPLVFSFLIPIVVLCVLLLPF